MRIPLALALCVVITACASSKGSARDEAPPAQSAQLPAAEQKPVQDKPTKPTKPAEPLQRSAEPAGPMTASEAADHLSRELQGAGGDAGRSAQPVQTGRAQADGGVGAAPPKESKEGDDALACNQDADCGFTRVAAGACCPMLCEPRVVAKKHAQALEKQAESCNAGKECPQPLCRPPRQQQTPACVEHKCTAKVSRTPIEN